MPGKRPADADPRNTNVRGQATRARVLDAAGSLFSRRGYDGTSLRDISKDSGAGLSSIMYHFGSKKQLFLETIRHFVVDNARLDRHFDPLVTVDTDNPRAVSNALRDTIESFLRAIHGPDRTEHVTGLYIHVIVYGDPDALAILLECFAGVQQLLPTFLKKVAPTMSQQDIDFWLQLFWSQLQYTVMGKKLVLYDMNLGSDYPESFIVEAAWRFARHVCLPLGLPDPTHKTC